MRRGVLILVVIGSTTLALWSAWNPGYYYLTRAAVFTGIGAGAAYLMTRDRNSRYALTAALFYVTLVLGISIAREMVTASSNQAESISVWYVPMFVVFLFAGVITAAAAGSRSSLSGSSGSDG